MTPSIIALIPARSGSKRVSNKNIRDLGGKPLMAWSIASALESGIFTHILVSSDSWEYGEIANAHNANFLYCSEVFGHGDGDPDILWVRHALANSHKWDAFAILRPTSPFRTAATIQRAWQHFLDNQPADSLRAVEPVKQHPGKMWVSRQGRLLPLLPFEHQLSPWHSSPTQILPEVYVQNASLEIAWAKTVTEQGTIAGTSIVPFSVPYPESINIDTEADWSQAEAIITQTVPDC